MILRARSVWRIVREEYALSASRASGLVRGLPCPVLATRRSPSRTGRVCPSCAWPGVTTTASGRPRPSTAWWTFVVNPPRERPIACPGGSWCDCGPWACTVPRHATGCRCGSGRRSLPRPGGGRPKACRVVLRYWVAEHVCSPTDRQRAAVDEALRATGHRTPQLVASGSTMSVDVLDHSGGYASDHRARGHVVGDDRAAATTASAPMVTP